MTHQSLLVRVPVHTLTTALPVSNGHHHLRRWCALCATIQAHIGHTVAQFMFFDKLPPPQRHQNFGLVRPLRILFVTGTAALLLTVLLEPVFCVIAFKAAPQHAQRQSNKKNQKQQQQQQQHSVAWSRVQKCSVLLRKCCIVLVWITLCAIHIDCCVAAHQSRDSRSFLVAAACIGVLLGPIEALLSDCVDYCARAIAHRIWLRRNSAEKSVQTVSISTEQ
jgi:hypothetical protein